MRARRLREGACLLVGLTTAWILSRRYGFVLDDAFISLRYARNFVEGHGLVFNAGLPPVEGYTNFLWVLVEACVVPFTPWPEHWLLLFDVLAGLLVVVAVWWELVCRDLTSSAWLLFGVMLVAGHETLAAWMGGGLETALVMCLVVLAVARFLREEFHALPGPWSALPLGLALLTRPEAYLVLFVCGAVRVLRACLQKPGRSFSGAAAWLGFCALFALPHLAFRRVYYGEWVPNTFFVKVSAPYFASGIPYVLIFCRANYVNALVVAAVFATAFAALRRAERFAGDRAVLSTLVFLWFAYVAYAGGDHFEFRLLAPTVPLLAILFALSAEDAWSAACRLREGRSAIARLGIAAVGVALVARVVVTSVRLGFAEDLFRLHIPSAASLARQDYAEEWRPAGEWLRRFARPGERISVPAAGIIPWESRLPTLDLHGLNDRTISHRPLVAHGVLAHEKSGTWEDVLAFGVVYHVDDLRFVAAPEEFGPGVLADNSRVVVQLPTHAWMNLGSPGDPDTLRRALRSRGARVYPGPSERAGGILESASASADFETWTQIVAAEAVRRRKADFLTAGVRDSRAEALHPGVLSP
jgi:hypothetical protein